MALEFKQLTLRSTVTPQYITKYQLYLENICKLPHNPLYNNALLENCQTFCDYGIIFIKIINK